MHRPGFKKLLADISAGQVGIVLALEASRLARSSADWHRLIEICSITRTLLADDGAVYDPREPNDRLLLGVKGTISEAELFTLRCRLHEGRWNKARRGALKRSLPVGYIARADGTIQKDPDRQVQARLAYVFRLFTRLQVGRKVLVQLRTRGPEAPHPSVGRSAARPGRVENAHLVGAGADTPQSDVCGGLRLRPMCLRLLCALGDHRQSAHPTAPPGRVAGVPAGRIPGLYFLGPVCRRLSASSVPIGTVRTIAGRLARGLPCSRAWSSVAAVAAKWASSTMPRVKNALLPTPVIRRIMPQGGRHASV